MDKCYKLSIVIITMNRASQLEEALNSCVSCCLPESVEFVIIDNGSTDNTKEIVDNFKNNNNYPVVYKYSQVNLGVGGGRALGFESASGEFLYFLDDDAVISEDSRQAFFVNTIKKFEENKEIASITTKIQDEILGDQRNQGSNNKVFVGDMPTVFKYLGGSHFLRKSCFDSPLYFNIRYGSEEYAPSLKAQDKGYYHVYDDSICIVHKPKINKWVDGSERKKQVVKCEVAITYATKRILYPWLFYPIIKLGFWRRCKLHLSRYDGAIKETKELAKQVIKENKSKKIKIKTVIKMYKNFGKTVF